MNTLLTDLENVLNRTAKLAEAVLDAGCKSNKEAVAIAIHLAHADENVSDYTAYDLSTHKRFMRAVNARFSWK